MEETSLTGGCLCGCGEPVRAGKRYRSGHHLKQRTIAYQKRDVAMQQRAASGATVEQLAAEYGLHPVTVRNVVGPVQAKKKVAKVAWVAASKLPRPRKCQKCRRLGSRIDAHHSDYDRPLDVRFLCRSCHMKAHRRRPGGIAESVSDKSRRTKWFMADLRARKIQRESAGLVWYGGDV